MPEALPRRRRRQQTEPGECERQPGAGAHLGRVDPEADERLHVGLLVQPPQLPEEPASLQLLIDDDLIRDAPPDLQWDA